MKKFILFLACIATLTACDNDDDFVGYGLETMPTVSVDTPEEMTLGNSYEFTINYVRPTSCYALYDLYYVVGTDDDVIEDEDPQYTRVVAPINIVYDESTCQEINELVDISFNFKPTELETYTFKFWTGKDEMEEDTFLVVQIPVVE